MSYPTYLVHFNPNHDPKTGQFTFNKYLTSDGKLTKYARDEYGLSRLDPSKKDFNPRKAKKAYEKEYYQSGKVFRKAQRRANDLMNELAEKDAEERLQRDIDKANRNKSFVSDWKNEVKKFFDVHKKDGEWESTIDKSIEYLKNKYPDMSDLIDGYSPHEHFFKYDDNELNDYMNMTPHEKTYRYKINNGEWQEDKYKVDPISYMLNNDFYYEPDYSGFGKKEINQLYTQANVEYGKYFIEKYGSEVVPESYVNWVKENS